MSVNFNKGKFIQGMIFIIIASLFAACSDQVEVNFILNSQDLKASNSSPDPLDEETVLMIKEGNKVVISNASEPSNSIDKLFWDLDGDGSFENEFEDKAHFSQTFNNAGLYKITLCVNTKETCISKWINVKESGIESIDLSPVLTFIKPEKDSVKSESAYFDIEIQTQNIFSKDELKLTVKNEAQRFSFDVATGLLTANNVRLEPGINPVEISTDTEEGPGVNSSVFIDFDPPANYQPPSPVDQPSGSSAPVVSIKQPGNGFRTTEERLPLAFRVSNLIVRSDFTVSLNGKPIRSDRFNSSGGLWKGTINLVPGSNTIEVKANTDGGESIESIEVHYDSSSPD